MSVLLLVAGAPGASVASPLRNTPIVQAVAKARPAVVNIQGRKTIRSEQLDGSGIDPFRQVNGMGTGIIIDARGFILTNFHVVENVQQIQVTTSEKATFVANVIAHDPITDLAVIKINSDEPLPVIDLGISSDLMPGEPVIAVGNAFGYEHTVTRGIISALHREVQVSASQKYHDLIQTDASINPGNSGGPLLNIDGEMIGINVAVRVGAQGIGFAIPVDEAMDIAARLLTVERVDNTIHGVIGQTRATDTLRMFVVSGLRPNSAAIQSGLQPGDIVVSADHMPIHRKLDFERALIGKSINQPVKLTVRRNGEMHTIDLPLTSAKQITSRIDGRIWQELGMKLAPVSEAEFRQLRSMYQGGLRVTSVRTDGPAADQGIRADDILVGMHIWETVSKDNLQYILNHPKIRELQPVKFYILRGNETLYGHIRVQTGNVLQASGSMDRR